MAKDFKGKKYYNKGKGNQDRKGKPKENHVPDTNDWSFYAATEQIAQQVASLPFNYLGGTSFELGPTGTDNVGNPINFGTAPALPGVMPLGYVNSIGGMSSDKTSGINLAATQLYTAIRRANSGARNYEPADSIMYVLAMRDIYSIFFHTKKVLGLTQTYNFLNHNTPRLLFEAMRVDYLDATANYAQYMAQLNVIASKINSFATPKYFRAFDRAAYMNSYVFCDSDSIRGQFYVYYPTVYYTWDTTSSQTGTMLKAHDVYTGAGNITVQRLMDIMNEMLNAMYLDTDALTLSGDILKAFDNAVYLVDQTDLNYATPFTYDEQVLNQIENSISINMSNSYNVLNAGNITANATLDVTQSDQLLVYAPVFTVLPKPGYPGKIALKNYLLNSHKAEPTYKDVLDYTRNMTIVNPAEVRDPETHKVTSMKYFVGSCGLEIITNMECVRYLGTDPTDGSTKIERSDIYTIYNNTNVTLSPATDLSNFDWHPIVYNLSPTGYTVESKLTLLPFGDVKVTTLVPVSILERIHSAACYGAFYYEGLYNAGKV